MNWETIGGICAVLGLLWGVYTYYNRQTPEYKEAKEFMLQNFDFLMRLNKSVLEQYENFADKYDAHHSIISEGLTLQFGIDKMRLVKKEISVEAYNDIKKNKQSLKRIEDVNQNLQKQIEYHSGLQTTLELFQNHIRLNHPDLRKLY